MTVRGLTQRSLAGGEIDSDLLARGDTAKNATGVRTCRNFVVTRRGTAENRSGTRYIATAKDSHADVRLERFKFNDAQTYVLEFGTGYIRFYREGAQLLTGTQSEWADATAYVTGDIRYGASGTSEDGNYFYCVAPHTSSDGTNGPHDSGSQTQFWYPLEETGSSAILEVPTPYAQGDLADLVVAQSADVVTITHRDHPPYELVRASNTAWTCLPVAFKSQATPPSSIQTAGKTGSAGSPGRLVRYQITAVDAASKAESITGYDSTVSSPRSVGNVASTTQDLLVTSAAHGLSTGDQVYVVEVTTAALPTESEANENAVIALQDCVFTVTVTGASTFTLDNTAGILTTPAIASSFPAIELTWAKAYYELTGRQWPFTASGNAIDMTWTAPTGMDVKEYRIYRSIDRGPFEFMIALNETSWEDGEDDDLVSDPEETPPEYVNPFRYGTWPRTSGYYQQRQVYAGSNDEPQKVWMSRTADFRNFAEHFPLLDDDPVEFAIAGTEANEIVSISSLGQLILLTNGAIWTALGDADETITPTAINLRALSYIGSAAVQPALVGDTVLFPESRGSIVRELRFNVVDGGYSGYAGRDLTVWAAHLFDGYTVVDWAYAHAPDPVVWVVRSDGTLLSMTYLLEQDIWAWARHDTGASGKFLSVTVVPEGTRDAPYVLVQRTVDGSDAYYVERIEPRQVGYPGVDERIVDFFADSGLSHDGTNTGSTTLTLSGGSTWNVGETGLTLTASASEFASGDVGNGYRLVGADSLEVECEITAYTSATVVTVSLLTAAPASTQATATSSWVKMVDDLSGLDHLEGESVKLLADGNALGPYTVTSGAIPSLDRPYGIIHAGLAISGQLETLDIDVVSAEDAVLDRTKTVNSANVMVSNTRGLKVGADPASAEALEEPEGYTAGDLMTGKLMGHFSGGQNLHGRFWMVQDDPLPATVLAWVTHVEFSDREN